MYPYGNHFADNWPGAAEAADASQTDDRLAHRVAERVLADPLIHTGRMEISVQNRVAVLEGHVDSPRAREAAARQAWATPGVCDVSNRLIAGT